MWRQLFNAVTSWIVWAVYRLWIATWRVSVFESEAVKSYIKEGKPWIIAMWHGDEVAIINFCRFYKVGTLTSTSKDGELMNSVLQRFGVKTSRGSSTRGGATALKGLIRITREGYSPVIPVDGPKGPRHKAKPGVFELAQILNLPIIPVGVACSSVKIFEKSWNKAYLPLLFSRVHLVWGDPFLVPKDVDPRDPNLAEKLNRELDAMGRKALNLFANT